jgi:hypothetical protein
MPERIAPDRPHHEEHDRENYPEDWNRPQQATKDEAGHRLSFPNREHHHHFDFLARP